MGVIQENAEEAEIDLDLMRKYVTYAKMKCAPRLSEEAGAALKDFYVKDRQEAGDRERSSKSSGKIPITVRQLEAMIRLSEALAKMELCDEVKQKHIEEAHRIFKISTLHAAKSGFSTNFSMPEELKDDVKKVQEIIKRKFAIGSKLSYMKLTNELGRIFTNTKSIEYAILGMVKNDEIKHFEGRRVLQRIK